MDYSNQKAFNEINSLEYNLLKVPYENLNKKFRATQKVLEKNNYRLKEAIVPLEAEFKASNGPIPVSQVAEQMQTVVHRLNQMEEEFDKMTTEELECAKALQDRADYLKQTLGCDHTPSQVEFFRKQRLNRFIMDHLLRAGYFETAQKLAEHCGIEQFSNAQVFHVAKQVEQSLAQGDLSIVLAWITENRSKLHRLDSDFETEIRIQQCIELIKQDRRMEAVTYTRKFSNIPAHKWTGSLLQLMGLIACGTNAPVEVYKKLVSDERWTYLVDRFRQENARMFQLSTQSAFSACLQAGIAAHKTPNCKKDLESKCVVCSELHELADGLPYAHASNSRLIDYYSGEPLNEQNQPLMLPNGRVYGEKTFHKLAKDGKFKCPRTGEEFQLEKIVRIFVL